MFILYIQRIQRRALPILDIKQTERALSLSLPPLSLSEKFIKYHDLGESGESGELRELTESGKLSELSELTEFGELGELGRLLAPVFSFL